MEQLTLFINTVGFPIVACVFMFKQNEKLSTSIMELTSTLKVIDERIEKIEREVKNEI